MVLLHGYPSSSTQWSGWVGPLTAAGARVLAIDMPGFGRSGGERFGGWEGLAREPGHWCTFGAQLGPAWAATRSCTAVLHGRGLCRVAGQVLCTELRVCMARHGTAPSCSL